MERVNGLVRCVDQLSIYRITVSNALPQQKGCMLYVQYWAKLQVTIAQFWTNRHHVEDCVFTGMEKFYELVAELIH